MRHVNIIKLYSVIETENQLHLVMEYQNNMPLNDFMKTKALKRLNEDEGKIIFRQLVEALRILHKHYVVHRDIKLENILVDDKKKVKLIDFGFSVVLPPNYKLNIFCGTPSYMAPEIVNKNDYSFGVDVWAAGILLFKMLSGHFPFKGNLI